MPKNEKNTFYLLILFYLYIYHSFIHLSILNQLSQLYCAFIAKIILLSLKKLRVLLVEVSNQQVVVWRLTSERDAITDSPPSLFHLELAWHLWLTALLLIIHLALGVWRSGDHLLGRWIEVALSSNIHWPAVLPIHSQNTQSPSLNTAQIRTQQLPQNSNSTDTVWMRVRVSACGSGMAVCMCVPCVWMTIVLLSAHMGYELVNRQNCWWATYPFSQMENSTESTWHSNPLNTVFSVITELNEFIKLHIFKGKFCVCFIIFLSIITFGHKSLVIPPMYTFGKQLLKQKTDCNRFIQHTALKGPYAISQFNVCYWVYSKPPKMRSLLSDPLQHWQSHFWFQFRAKCCSYEIFSE